MKQNSEVVGLEISIIPQMKFLLKIGTVRARSVRVVLLHTEVGEDKLFETVYIHNTYVHTMYV